MNHDPHYRCICAALTILVVWTCSTLAANIDLVWIPNGEGIFSQFLQLRVIHHVAKEVFGNDSLTVAIPFFDTNHFNQSILDLCSIFNLPKYIQCKPCVVVNKNTCSKHAAVIRTAYDFRHYGKTNHSIRDELLQIGSAADTASLVAAKGSDCMTTTTPTHHTVCYSKGVPTLGGRTRRDAFLRAISFPLPIFELHRDYTKAFVDYKAKLFENALLQHHDITVDDPLFSANYTVVHWRRGDQLSSRCRQRKDQSVNCGDASELIEEVGRLSRDHLVYVATNEDPRSQDSKTLRQHGYLLFDERLSSFRHGSVGSFLLEVQLMLDATTYLGWGVSIVNDVIEHERMLRGKSWCATNDFQPSYPTWCWLQHQRLLHIMNATEIADIRALPYSLMQRIDANTTRTHLLLSDFNISGMHIYRKEASSM